MDDDIEQRQKRAGWVEVQLILPHSQIELSLDYRAKLRKIC